MSEKILKNLWAKKRVENGSFRWLPLLVHLEDTMNTINFLYNQWLSDGQKQVLRTEFENEEQVQSFIKFLGYIHDIGKATPLFQKKESYSGNQDIDEILVEKLLLSGLKGFENFKSEEKSKSPHALAGEAILEKAGINTYIGAIIGGHHGKTLDKTPLENIDKYVVNYFQNEKDEELKKTWRTIHQEIIELALKKSGISNISELPRELTQPQAFLAEGLLIMADWLSSSEYWSDNAEIPLFPLIDIDSGLDDIDLKQRSRNALIYWFKTIGIWTPKNNDNASEIYKKRWGFEPRNVQKVISDTLNEANNPGIVVIEAPMGLGKTEIALVAAEQLAYKSHRNGVFIGLPTQATTNAMFSRVLDWLQSIAEEQREEEFDFDLDLNIKLLHGKAKFNPNYQKLPQSTNVNYDEENEDASVTVNTWFSGKKSILSNFAVGTVDNLLLMALKQKHLFLRHLGLTGKVVIVDEVHAYDTYMSKYLERALYWLGAYETPVVLLSATLPSKTKNDLVSAYLKGRVGSKIAKQKIKDAKLQEDNSYPKLIYSDGADIYQENSFGEIGQKQKIQVEYLDLKDEELLSHILNQIANGGVAGIIVNTIKRAQNLAKMIPTDIEVMLLHSSFITPDRVNQEQILQSKIGKNAKRPNKMIVIGTQVLEQSLDIDFDVLYTDIAPMDLVLQRMGRLHRHDIKRPQNLTDSKVYLLGIHEDGYDDGAKAVYGEYLLRKTDYFISKKDTIQIPGDIANLVNDVYDKNNDKNIPNLKDAKKQFEKLQKQKNDKAKVFRVSQPLGTPKNILGFFKNSHSDVKTEQKAQAAVRDIDETIEVILLKKVGNEFLMMDNRSINDVSSMEIAEQTVRLPKIVSLGKIEECIKSLEKLTYRNFKDWQQDIWLKGSLVLILDENQEADFMDIHFKYSQKYGLEYSKING